MTSVVVRVPVVQRLVVTRPVASTVHLGGGGGPAGLVVTQPVASTVRVGVSTGPPGPQGEPGPDGPPGPAGPAGFTYVHEQTVSAATWIVNHLLDGYPAVTLISDDGEQVEADIHYTSTDVVTVVFPTPTTGKAAFS